MKDKALQILNELTLEEKAGLCSGADFWHLKSVERMGLNKIMVTDGPHGLRKQSGDSDHVGLNKSVPATCFPTASATACSWDTNLMFEMGEALGEECLQENVAVLLGPGANIKRSPLCGRNFEYISEDPYHTGNMASALINGVQSKGIGTSLKHYAMNNQEGRRMTIDAVVDERAQREIYLAGFEWAVKKAQPWTVMCSYNKVDGTYLSDNKRLLTDILKDEWGHTGLVVTDWGATNDRVLGIQAGLELEMPSSGGRNDQKIMEAINSGLLSIQQLDNAVLRVIELILKSQAAAKSDYHYDVSRHHELAGRMVAGSAVLLKNHDILPQSAKANIAIIGEFAKTPRYQGAGSSIINPHKIDNVCQKLDEQHIRYQYAQGYRINSAQPDQILIDEAVQLAKTADTVFVFAGLTDNYESEGFDRKHLNLPESHNELINQIAAVHSNIVIVLHNGAPVEMPWVHKVKGILECYLFGQAGAGAIVDILFGKINPSGKLAETFPLKLEDTPCFHYFPGNEKTVEYRESIYVGYRYYDSAKKEVLFPFGFGLSYTTFEYSDLQIQKKDALSYDVAVKIKNTGGIAGSEIVQLYVKNNISVIFKAEKELRAFSKILLEPGETKLVTFSLDQRSFAYYHTGIKNWHVDAGEYTISIGSSSRDIRLSENVPIEINDGVIIPDYRDTAKDYYHLQDSTFSVSDKQFEMLYGKPLPEKNRKKGEPFHSSSSMYDIKEKFIGRLINKMIMSQAKKMFDNGEADVEEGNVAMMEAIVSEMPLRSLGMMGGDKLPKYFVEGIVEMLNGRFFKGMGMIMKKN